jgi:hypothetical protein
MKRTCSRASVSAPNAAAAVGAGSRLVALPPARPGPSGLPPCSRAACQALGSHRPACRSGALGGSAARGCATGLPRQCRPRRRAPRLALERPRHGARNARTSASLAFVLARRIGVGRTPTGARLGPSFPGRTKRNSRAPGLGKADGNCLLRRPRPMFAAADLADLLVHEFAGLRGRRLARALGFAGLFHCSFLRHHRSPCCRFRYDVCASSGRASRVVGAFQLIAHTVNARLRRIDPLRLKCSHAASCPARVAPCGRA